MGRKVTIQEAAATYGVHPLTIRRWIGSGRLTAYRVGPRLIRLDADQMQAQLLGEPVEVDS